MMRKHKSTLFLQKKHIFFHYMLKEGSEMRSFIVHIKKPSGQCPWQNFTKNSMRFNSSNKYSQINNIKKQINR